MLEFLTARLGIAISKRLIVVLTLSFLWAAGGLGFWRGMENIRIMVMTAAKDARANAIAERDAAWKAEIATSNAAVERQRAEQAIVAAAADAAARAEIDRLKGELADLEKRNAQLPNGADRGLGRDRVRLLNHP